MRVRLSILVCVALSLAACGGGNSSTTTAAAGGTSPQDWATGVCTAVNTYELALQTAAKSFTQNPSKAGINTALSAADQATQTLSTTLKGLGKPNTAAGDTAQKTIENLATKISADVDKVKQSASSGSTLQAAATISTTLGSMKGSITTVVSTLQSLQGGELQSAFASSPSCAKLTGKK
jgi:type IV pilus biogenesis protein CpaD/CtpE